MIKSTHGDRFEDDGIMFESFDYEGMKLRIRVGPVYTPEYQNGQGHPEKAIWIEMNDEFFLMSQATWVALNDHIHRRVSDWKKFTDLMKEEL